MDVTFSPWRDWALRNWCFWITVLKTLESLGLQGDPTNPKGNQPRIFTGKTDAKADAPILWPPDAMSQLIGQDPDAEKGWRGKKRATEELMFREHHWRNGNEFEQTRGDSAGKGSLVCCSRWSCRVRHSLSTEQLQIQGIRQHFQHPNFSSSYKRVWLLLGLRY